MRIGRQLCLIVVTLIGASAAIAQTLNPTVTLLAEPAGTVPPDCFDPDAKPVQRAAVEPEPQPARPVPAPQPTPVIAPVTTVEARDVRSALRGAHAAAVARDRGAYDAALAAAKALVPASGTDRELANDVLALFADVTRLWDYGLTAPIGSFFDSTAQGGSLLRMLNARPGYEDFVRRQIIVDANGTRFYPTRESIDFLLGLIANRLGRGGVSVARQTEQPRPVVTQPPPSPAPQPRVATAAPQPQPRTASRTERAESTTRKSTSRPRKTTARRETARQQPAQPQPAIATPAEEPAVPPGVIATPPAEPSATTDTATTSIAPPAIDTTFTTDTVAATDTTSTAAAAAQEPRRRSIILPIVLILIGVGVLIILFRASS